MCVTSLNVSWNLREAESTIWKQCGNKVISAIFWFCYIEFCISAENQEITTYPTFLTGLLMMRFKIFKSCGIHSQKAIAKQFVYHIRLAAHVAIHHKIQVQKESGGTLFDHHQHSQPLAGTSLQFRLLIILHKLRVNSAQIWLPSYLIIANERGLYACFYQLYTKGAILGAAPKWSWLKYVIEM